MWEDSTNKKKREKKKDTDGFVFKVFPGLSFSSLLCKAAYTWGFFVTSFMVKISVYYQHIYFLVQLCYFLHMQVRWIKEIPIQDLCNKAVKKVLNRTQYGPLFLEKGRCSKINHILKLNYQNIFMIKCKLLETDKKQL